MFRIHSTLYPGKSICKIAYLLICLFISCKPESEQIPSDLIDKDKMAGVLVDVHIIEASLDLNGLIQQEIDAAMTQRYAQVMKKNSITMKQFTDSYNYYIHHPDQMDEIYQEVVNRLTALESNLKATHKTQIDSTKRVEQRRQ